MLERPLREREVVGSIPGHAVPEALKMLPVATLLGAQHYKASTGSSLTHGFVEIPEHTETPEHTNNQ